MAAFRGMVTVHNRTETERCPSIYLFAQIKLSNILVRYNKCAVGLEEKRVQSCSDMRATANALCPIDPAWEEAFFPCKGSPLNWGTTQSLFVAQIEQHERSHDGVVCL